MALIDIGQGKEKQVYKVKDEAWSLNKFSLDKDNLFLNKESIKASFYLGQIARALMSDRFPVYKSLEFTREDKNGAMAENVLLITEYIPGENASKLDAPLVQSQIYNFIQELKSNGFHDSTVDVASTNFIKKPLDESFVYVDSLYPVRIQDKKYVLSVDVDKVASQIESRFNGDEKSKLLSLLKQYEDLAKQMVEKLNNKYGPNFFKIREEIIAKLIRS